MTQKSIILLSSNFKEIKNGLQGNKRNSLSPIDQALIVGENSGEPVLFDNEVFKERMRNKYTD